MTAIYFFIFWTPRILSLTVDVKMYDYNGWSNHYLTIKTQFELVTIKIDCVQIKSQIDISKFVTTFFNEWKTEVTLLEQAENKLIGEEEENRERKRKESEVVSKMVILIKSYSEVNFTNELPWNSIFSSKNLRNVFNLNSLGFEGLDVIFKLKTRLRRNHKNITLASFNRWRTDWPRT